MIPICVGCGERAIYQFVMYARGKETYPESGRYCAVCMYDKTIKKPDLPTFRRELNA